jgi:hypothetical protein
MTDFEAFQEALHTDATSPSGDTYMSSLNQSMALVLDEFYQHLRTVGVSAVTGEGMPEFFEAVQSSVEEYETEYKPMLEKMMLERVIVLSCLSQPYLIFIRPNAKQRRRKRTWSEC